MEFLPAVTNVFSIKSTALILPVLPSRNISEQAPFGIIMSFVGIKKFSIVSL
jgi:hypothetical protein